MYRNMQSSFVHLRKHSGSLVCDHIQIPPDGPFDSSHLKWFSEEAWIPENRLLDFVEGEEHRPLCNTNFKTTQTEPYHSLVTGELLRTKKRYHCSYGPRDGRHNAETVLPNKRKYDNGKIPLRHTTLTGTSVQRGCTCHFYVTRFEDRAHAVKITWLSRGHVDKAGLPCHGLADKTAEFKNAHVAHRLSRRTWNFVERLLRTGVSTSEVVMAHFRNLRNHWRHFWPSDQNPSTRWSRDMMLTPRDIKCIRQSILRKKIDYNTADHLAVHSWTENNKEQVFLYQQKTDEDTPFLLGWASEWQIHKAATLGHGGTIAMDATFGTNVFDIPLFTILAYDDHQNGIPVAWGLLEKAKTEHLVQFLEAFNKRVKEVRKEMLLDPNWKPTCFMIDVASEEILSLRTVFPDVPIILCLWHVRRAWTKNLISKVKDLFNRAEMNRELKDLMYNESEDPVADSMAFVAKWEPTAKTFTDYFTSFWHPKLERWMVQYRSFAHNNQNTNGAVERWHHTMKMHLRTQKATKSGRSIQWLIGMLTEDLELFYWCMLSLKFQGAIRNKVKEGYVFNAIHKAREIADSQVTYLTARPDGGRQAEVRTYKEDGTEKVHLVQNWNKDHCSCTCGHSEQGNHCKHQIKILMMDGYDEMRLLNLLGTKWGSCCGGLEYEYEVLAEEDVEEEIEVHHPVANEADISFPLKTFAALEAEVPEDKLDVAYHDYSEDYFVGIVKAGYTKLEKLGGQFKNMALVRLKQWLEWIRNEEALADPAELDQFPLTQFLKPKDSDNSLKRKKDYVEEYWGKKNRGTRGKSKEEVAVAKENKKKLQTDEMKTPSGWNKVELKPIAKSNLTVGQPSSDMTKSTHDLTDHAAEGTTDQASTEVLSCLVQGQVQPTFSTICADSNKTQKDIVLLPFVQKRKRKESDQQKLDREARESINLNNCPMDYEKPDSPEQHDVNVVFTSAPKRRGRLVGSKNKAKVAALSKIDPRPPLGAMPGNIMSQVKTARAQQNLLVKTSHAIRSSAGENEDPSQFSTLTQLSCMTASEVNCASVIPVKQCLPQVDSDNQWLYDSVCDDELVVRLAA